jgi:Fic family protein
MSDLEKFLHNEEIDAPAIIRIAIAHYQFETIHPFLDGNGRIGRLLITLYLVSTRILDQPLLYLSTYFEKDKSQYFEKLDRVRHESDLMQWLRYFLTGLKDTAEEAVQVLKDVLALKNELETYITNHYGRKSDSALRLLNQLFRDPVTQVSDVAANCQISKKAANDLVQNFIQSGILKEVTGRSKGRVYVFDRYINLYAGNT